MAIAAPASTVALWWKGGAVQLRPEWLRSAAGHVGLSVGPSGEVLPASVAWAVQILEGLAGQEKVSEVDLRALSRSQSAAAIGTLVRLMVRSKSDAVKLRAAVILLERG